MFNTGQQTNHAGSAVKLQSFETNGNGNCLANGVAQDILAKLSAGERLLPLDASLDRYFSLSNTLSGKSSLLRRLTAVLNSTQDPQLKGELEVLAIAISVCRNADDLKAIVDKYIHRDMHRKTYAADMIEIALGHILRDLMKTELQGFITRKAERGIGSSAHEQALLDDLNANDYADAEKTHAPYLEDITGCNIRIYDQDHSSGLAHYTEATTLSRDESSVGIFNPEQPTVLLLRTPGHFSTAKAEFTAPSSHAVIRALELKMQASFQHYQQSLASTDLAGDDARMAYLQDFQNYHTALGNTDGGICRLTGVLNDLYEFSGDALVLEQIQIIKRAVIEAKSAASTHLQYRQAITVDCFVSNGNEPLSVARAAIAPASPPRLKANLTKRPKQEDLRQPRQRPKKQEPQNSISELVNLAKETKQKAENQTAGTEAIAFHNVLGSFATFYAEAKANEKQTKEQIANNLWQDYKIGNKAECDGIDSLDNLAKRNPALRSLFDQQAEDIFHTAKAERRKHDPRS